MTYSLSTPLPFGMHKGKTVQELADNFSTFDYLVWCTEEVDGFKLDHEATAYAKKKLREHVTRAMKSGELDNCDSWKIKQELKEFDKEETHGKAQESISK